MTPVEAISNACRILENVEGDNNLPAVDALTRVAEAWISIAQILHDCEMEA